MTENPNTSSIPVSSKSYFGDVEILKTESQQLNMAIETTFNFQNALAIPSIGMLADFTFWVTGLCSYFRIIITLAFLGVDFIYILFLIGVPLIFGLCVFALTWNNGKFLFHLMYRFTLILVAFMISTHWFL